MTHNRANADIELDEEATAWLVQHLEETDALNAAIGITGPEVARYNIREARLRLAERRLLDANVELRRLQREHESNEVTKKIETYRWAQEKLARLTQHNEV